MFNCKQVMEALVNYLDDEVTQAVRRDLEMHLAECKTCRVLYDSTRKTMKIVADNYHLELPETVSTRVAQRIMSQIRERQAVRDPGES